MAQVECFPLEAFVRSLYHVIGAAAMLIAAASRVHGESGSAQPRRSGGVVWPDGEQCWVVGWALSAERVWRVTDVLCCERRGVWQCGSE